MCTLKSLIEKHARLDFSDFHSTLLAIFYVVNEKFHPARLLIYLVKNKQIDILFQSARLLGTSETRECRLLHQACITYM